MVTKFGHKLLGKRRKYPIKRNELGLSARQRAFAAFDQGLRPAQVAPAVDTSLRTACRYYADWKKLPKNFGMRYELAKTALRDKGEFSEQVIQILAGALGMSREEVIERLQKPWGIKQLLMGRWPNRVREIRQNIYEARLEAALRLIVFLEHLNEPPEEIMAWLLRLRQKAQEYKSYQQRALEMGL